MFGIALRCATLFVICTILILSFCNYVIRTNNNISKYVELEKYSGKYLINTSGCRVPFFPVQLPKKFDSCALKIHCGKSIFITNDFDGYLIPNLTLEEYQDYFKDWSSINCYYNEFIRINDRKVKHLEKYYFQFDIDNPIVIKDGMEFVRVICYDDYYQTNYTDFFFFAIEKNDMESGISTNNELIEGKSNERLSVMILGVDSVSHFNFIREMKKTTNFVRKYSGSVEFWGYNKIDINTYPNMVPVLTGQTSEEVEKTCYKPRKTGFDHCSIIWDNFKKAGFKTAYAEDIGKTGIFNYLKSGFVKQPTDYYLLTLLRQMENSLIFRRRGHFCANGRRTDDILLESARKMIPLLLKHDFFSLFWEVTITHDCLNMASMFDNGLANLLIKFNETGVFNKTFVFLLSDHGLRWGPIHRTLRGRYEDSHIMLAVLYPKWFEKQYPTAVKNLQINSKRLTTVFDIYETMLDLVDIRKLDEDTLKNRTNQFNNEEQLPRGISLFLPIPESRTCKQAGISVSYCNCFKLEHISKYDPRVIFAARFSVNHINLLISPYKECAQLQLSVITWSRKMINSQFIEFISVRFQTQPGNGVFESTVYVNGSLSKLEGTVERDNGYDQQSRCMHNKTIKEYCYCQDL